MRKCSKIGHIKFRYIQKPAIQLGMFYFCLKQLVVPAYKKNQAIKAFSAKRRII